MSTYYTIKKDKSWKNSEPVHILDDIAHQIAHEVAYSDHYGYESEVSVSDIAEKFGYTLGEIFLITEYVNYE